MGRIYTVPFSEDLVRVVAEEVYGEGAPGERDFSRVAVVFPGRRPGLFLRKYLARLVGGAYRPPALFSIEEFTAYLARKLRPGMRLLSPLDGAWLLYQTVKALPQDHPLTKGGFREFFPWGHRLLGLLDELEAWLVRDEQLKAIAAGVEYQPTLPPTAQALWGDLLTLRQEFWQRLEREGFTTEGRDSALAADGVSRDGLPEFDRIYFVGFFALTASEERLMRTLWEEGRARIIWQTDGGEWEVFQRVLEGWGAEPVPLREFTLKPEPQVKLYAGFDTHSEVDLVRQILRELEGEGRLDPEQTVVVLPRPEALIPLLSEAMGSLDVKFNVSLGYPLSRTPLYALLDQALRAQEAARDKNGERFYHTRAYLGVLLHPYVKNIHIRGESTPIRILAHLIEEKLRQEGRTFIRLADLEQDRELWAEVEPGLAPELRQILQLIHQTFFLAPERIESISGLARCLGDMTSLLVERSPLAKYPFSGEVINQLFEVLDGLEDSLPSQEPIEGGELFDLFRHYTLTQRIPFAGTPLKGLQVLGLLETRALRFREAIVLDVNEEVIPSADPYDPLLPPDLRSLLGLPDHRDQEELFRYYLYRLMGGAQTVHLVYQQTGEKMRSRFIEELVWERELREGKLDVLKPVGKGFRVGLVRKEPLQVPKTPEVLQGLRDMGFSYTALDVYLHCPLRFYYRYALGLREREELSGEVEADRIGKIIHRILYRFYQPYEGKHLEISPDFRDRLSGLVEEVFEDALGPEWSGEHFLLKEVIKHQLSRFIGADREKGVQILALEREAAASMEIRGIKVRLRGRFDRVQREGDLVVIGDYKTGYAPEFPRRKKLLEMGSPPPDREQMGELIRSFQLPFYLYLYHWEEGEPWEGLEAVLYRLRRVGPGGQWELRLFDRENGTELMERVFLPSLRALLAEILDPEVPFVRDGEKRYCQGCPYGALCQRAG